MLNRKVIITGVAGFLSRHAAVHFFNRGWRVIGIDTVEPEKAHRPYLSSYFPLHLPSSELSAILEKHRPDLCIHCAGSASVGLSVSDPAADFYSGTVLTFEILNALRLHAPSCRFMFMSSAAVYGNPESLPVKETHPCNPISPYGFHKWQGEQLCLEFSKVYGLRTSSLRIFSAYGPGLRRQVIWDICRKAITRQKLILQGTGRESRDFVHAYDIAVAMETVAISAPMLGEVYNVGTGREVAIEELAHIVLKALGIDGAPIFDGLVPQGNPLNWRADISSLSTIGFAPTVTLEQGVQSFADWFRGEVAG